MYSIRARCKSCPHHCEVVMDFEDKDELIGNVSIDVACQTLQYGSFPHTDWKAEVWSDDMRISGQDMPPIGNYVATQRCLGCERHCEMSLPPNTRMGKDDCMLGKHRPHWGQVELL